ncbi:MAG TPA: hypothetical protein VFS20_32820 [Longimicrobium sp.]|nr:hypothetical protein [Longimicrobium sp.]
MQCIHCGTHSRLSQRKDGRCPKCQHRFTFEPTTDRASVTDSQFKNAIDRLSGGGRLFFTERNLWYELYRRWAHDGIWRYTYPMAPYVLTGIIPGVVLANLLEMPSLYLLCGLGALAGMGIAKYRTWRYGRQPPLPQPGPRTSFEAFQEQHLARWIEVNGPIPGLLPRREQAAAAMPRKVPPDVAAFSFDRVVVTDRWDTAQMLVANRFHFEHNCAVLSRDGYPDGIAGTLTEMLRRNPRLTVFALHDPSVEGCHLPLILRQPEWFPDPAVRIVDLGMRPATAERLRIPAERGPAIRRPLLLAKMLTKEELTWLTHGRSWELAALRPTQVMRAVYKGIVTAAPNDGSPSGGTDGGGDSYHGGAVFWIGDMRPGVDTAKVDGFG